MGFPSCTGDEQDFHLMIIKEENGLYGHAMWSSMLKIWWNLKKKSFGQIVGYVG